MGLHYTVTSLVKSIHDWYNGMHTGKLIWVVFIDLKKAFDTLNHDILYQTLEYYGIKGRELAWFRSYLSNWKQFSRVNGVDSVTREMRVVYLWAHVLDLVYFSFTSMVYQVLSKIQKCPYLLMTCASTTSLVISLC